MGAHLNDSQGPAGCHRDRHANIGKVSRKGHIGRVMEYIGGVIGNRQPQRANRESWGIVVSAAARGLLVESWSSVTSAAKGTSVES